MQTSQFKLAAAVHQHEIVTSSMALKIFVNICSAFLMLILICSLSCTNSDKDLEQRALFKQIKAGMKKDDVIKILGRPDTIYSSIVDSSEKEFIYFSKNKQMKSNLPTVSFDSNKVVSADYGN